MSINLKKELDNAHSDYYFVNYDPSSQFEATSTIGIFKLIHNCVYKPLPQLKALKVHRIYLDANIQGKGIGKQLMLYAEDVGRVNNFDIIWLDAMDTHEQAQAFYHKLGYEKTQLQHLPFELLYDEHRPMWYMHKNL